MARHDQNLDIAGFLRLVLDALHAAGVHYLVGGAVAEWAWGEPRATQDLDLVVDVPVDSIGKLSKELERRDMLVPADIIRDAVLDDRADVPINAIHLSSGFKADLYPVRPGDELRRSAFQRRQKVDYGPPIGAIYVHSPEDLIIYKLTYFSISRQTKHTRDIAAILRARKDQLDMEYVEKWVNRLGLFPIWEEILHSLS